MFYAIFDLQNIASFFLGLLSGAILMVLLYFLLVILTLRKRNYIIETELNNISEEDIKKMIKDSQNRYLLERNDDNEEIKNKALQSNTIMLIQNIAAKFYPKSNRPLAELTIDELILLDKYIVKRVEEIIDRPGLRIIKRFRLNTIINVANMKKKVDQSSIVKTSKKLRVKEIANGVLMAVNFINPVYWFKKLVLDNVASLIIKKISLCVISIAGEETYRIYSKQAFKEEDEELQKLVNELENDTKLIEDSNKKTPKH